MPAPHEITPDQLSRLIGTPDCPMIVDVCIDEDFRDDPYLVPSSFRHSHKDLPGLAAKLGNAPSVIICQKGKKLSQGVAAWLRAEGHLAEYLQGGMYAWRDMPDAPRLPADRVPSPSAGPSFWVTRQRPKIDRIACPWLIRRFIDRGAKFLFVAAGEVLDVADKLGATPFDVEGAELNHSGGKCSFDAIMHAYNLRLPALERMAVVIRAADTGEHGQAPEAVGLLAVSLGLSRQYKDDNAQLEAGLHIYDALFRWARDGFNETHAWPERHV